MLHRYSTQKSTMTYLVDISNIGNGIAAQAYGGSLRAYSFEEVNQDEWFTSFLDRVVLASNLNHFLPVVRIGDGEIMLLYPELLLNRSKLLSLKNLKVILNSLMLVGIKTSWGEEYSSKQVFKARHLFRKMLGFLASKGVIALYWNVNSLNAFATHNKFIQERMKRDNIILTQDNYVPFHFPLAAMFQPYAQILFSAKKILFISSISEIEQQNLGSFLTRYQPTSIDFYQIPKTQAHRAHVTIENKFDLVLVSAGIAAISIIYQLRHLTCPCIDIGGIIHLLSGQKPDYHGGFFTTEYDEKP